jgi:hypothetical protein
VSYANCDDARARGAAPVLSGQPGYRPGLDSDSDGIGCEEEFGTAATPAGVTPAAATPAGVTPAAVTPAATRTTATGSLAFTGVEVALLLTAGAVLLVVGSTLVAVGRRRS